MTTDEQRAYLLNTLRKSPEGSARRIWAQAQLNALNAKTAQAGAQPGTTKTRRTS